MRVIHAEAGQSVYDFLLDALGKLCWSNENACYVQHNETRIVIHKDSSIVDLCDKFDLQAKINRLESQYRR